MGGTGPTSTVLARVAAALDSRIGLRNGGLLRICCPRPEIRGRSRPNMAVDLGWS
jgi:hypothetical protein